MMESSHHSISATQISPSQQPQNQTNQHLNPNQSQPFLQSYKQQVLYPNTIDLIVYTIILYFIFLIADVYMFNSQQLVRSQSQQNYLTNLKVKFQMQRQDWLGDVRMFVDLYRQIHAMSIQTTQTDVLCNQTRYFCSEASQGAWNSVEKHYELIQMNYNRLIKKLSKSQDCQIFLYNPSLSNPILSYNFASSKNYRINLLLKSLISSFTDTNYFYKLLNKYIAENISQIKLLICGRVPTINSSAKICVITPGSLEDPISQKDNPIKIINQNQINAYKTQILNIQNQTNSYNFQSQKAQEVINSYVQQQDSLFYNSYSVTQCINQFKKTQYLIQNKIRICNPPQLFLFLARETIFFYSSIKMKSRYFLEDVSSAAKINQYEIKFLIFSNKTFYQSSNIRLKTFNKKQSYILLTMILIIIFWLILMPIFPLKIIGGEISLSVALLIKMCRAVKLIKNKDDLEKQIDNFNKLNAEIGKLQHIFYSTIQYFQYFIWYRKWLYINKISKKKALLEQGLTLFGSADYAPVTLYIYKNQIQSEIKLVQKYKKMRRIITQKFVVYQNDEKILANMVKNKSRITSNIGQIYKKSGFRKQQNLIDNDFCMIQNIQKNIQNRINKQLQLMQMQKKSKRFVRFSNDLQQQNNKVSYKVSKFLLNIPNQSKLKNSQKSIQEQIKKKQQQDFGSNLVESSRDDKIDLKDQQSQISQKVNEKWDMKIKFDKQDQPSSIDITQDQSFDIKRFDLRKLDQKIGQTYENIFRTYQKIAVSKKIYIETLQTAEVNQEYNHLYSMLIEKLRYTYKFVKQKNKQRQKILKQLSRKLLNVKREKIGTKNFDFFAMDKYFDSEKCLHDTISVIQQGLEQESKLIDIQFLQFKSIEERFKIDPDLMQRARLYQTKLLKIMNYPVPYKQLQKLCESKNSQIRVQSKIILAQQFFHISPHADYQILMKALQNLNQSHTTHSQKQKTLKLIKRVLRNREMMQQSQYQVELIINHYNYSHKKIYFVADLTDNYELFRPVLEEIYKNMDNVDIFQIMNLAMNESLQDMAVGGSKIKSPKLQDFQIQFQNLHNQMNKIKSMASTKAGKKITLQKDFNKILNQVQFEEINLSKFIVLILGGQNQTQSKTYEDYQSTSAQNRQQFQQIHQQILSKISRNYFHVILIGFNLKDTQTRQGKLKKYIRHAHDIIQIDLSKPNYKSLFKDLCKFMN